MSCGYDLRGLQCDGRCPECGGAIEASIAKWRAAKPGLAGADAGWLRQVQSGLRLLLIADAGAIGVTIVFDAFTDEARPWLLYIVCTAWTLGHLGMWRLLTCSPSAGLMAGQRWLRGIACALAVLSVFTPIWIYLPYATRRWFGGEYGEWRAWEWTTLLVLCGLWAGVVGSALSLARMVQCAAKDNRKWLARLAIPAVVLYVASISFLLIFWTRDMFDPDIRSLEGLLFLPWPTHGLPWLVRIWTRMLGDWSFDFVSLRPEGILILTLTAGQLGTLALNTTTLITVRRALIQQRKHTAPVTV